MNKPKQETPDNLTICKMCRLADTCASLTKEQADYDESGKCIIDCRFFAQKRGVDHAETTC